MKKITLEISEVLLRKIEETVLSEGFHSRSEFLRFLIMTYAKKNEVGSGRKTEHGEEEVDEFADVDLEFGVPIEVIKKLEKKAREMTENELRPLS
jgi:Arc/MetJ-type ribon-helix-helix transcriptional regulator